MLVPDNAMRQLLTQRFKTYTEQFWKSEEAQRYWVGRGLSVQMAKVFFVGFVSQPLRGDSRFTNRLAIPYITANNQPVSYKFRAIEETKKRYDKDKNDPSRIFNTRVLRSARKVVITEGEIDAIAATQCGLQAVGVPGANNWKPEWTRIFRNRLVTVLADGDEAGEEFADRVSSLLYGVRVVMMPQGEDTCSMLKEKGEEWIREMVVL